jgi:hypothetical protein
MSDERETGRAATHTDSQEDAILAAWQATDALLRRYPWMAFRAGYRAGRIRAVAAEAERDALREALRNPGGELLQAMWADGPDLRGIDGRFPVTWADRAREILRRFAEHIDPVFAASVSKEKVSSELSIAAQTAMEDALDAAVASDGNTMPCDFRHGWLACREWAEKRHVERMGPVVLATSEQERRAIAAEERERETRQALDKVCALVAVPDCASCHAEGIDWEGDEWAPCECVLTLERERALREALGELVRLHDLKVKDQAAYAREGGVAKELAWQAGRVALACTALQEMPR